MEVEVKNENNDLISSFYIPIQIEPTSKGNVNSENTPNYFEQMENALKDFKIETEDLVKGIKKAEKIRKDNEIEREQT